MYIGDVCVLIHRRDQLVMRVTYYTDMIIDNVIINMSLLSFYLNCDSSKKSFLSSRDACITNTRTHV
jgi:hypothetical protein